MGNSLDKVHVTSTYRDTTAASQINNVMMEKLHVTAVYRNTSAGFINEVLFDKFYVTAVYRYDASFGGRRRRSINVFT
ncbi:hypothetical protein [Mesorhizobium cantuariense]|uniref:Uncharacterized protein n=1 Tax=Mesorhizobium cantuariense TaxID=1300275 RepID=A0ABV7MKQ2_9HYPH